MLNYASKQTLEAFVKENDARYAKIEDIHEYSLKRKDTAEHGYTASYQLTKDGVAVGENINIPKDYLVKEASLKTVTVANNPLTGYKVGDKYIDFAINTVDNDAETSHIYLLVSELVDAYSGGNGINISKDNIVTLTIDSNNANGLALTSNGLKLNIATETYPGAMSANDKKKLNASLTSSDFSEITADEVTALFQ